MPLRRPLHVPVLILGSALFALLAPLRAADSPASPPPEHPLVPVCVVSGDHLQAGEIVTYVYHQPGQPDRKLRFCCHKCLARFKADPARYLARLDELEAAARKPRSP